MNNKVEHSYYTDKPKYVLSYYFDMLELSALQYTENKHDGLRSKCFNGIWKQKTI